MESTAQILIDKGGGVTTFIINRPNVKNALDLRTTTELGAALRDFEEDATAKVAVLAGANGTFCAGADLKELASGAVYSAWAGSDGPLSRPLAKPIIAAIAGHACAGGLGLALWCDIRVADNTASFAVLSRRWGVPMTDGTTVRLPRIVGLGRALDMLLTARIVGAEEAVEFGLVNRLVPVGESLSAAQALARTMCGFPQIAMRSDRLSAYEQSGMPLPQALSHEEVLAASAKKLEALEGAQRFTAGDGRHGSIA